MGLEGDSSPLRQLTINIMMAYVFLRISAGILASLTLAGCGGGEFDPTGILEGHPVNLDGEQVILDQGQVECGAHEDLWSLSSSGDGRGIARLTAKGRELNFSDDVQIGDPALLGLPYAQIHGALPVRVLRMGSAKDEDEWTKLVDARVAVTIDHVCFQANPVILLGVRHGQFDASTNPVFRFKRDGEWAVDKAVH